MIDAESEIYSAVYAGLVEKFPGLNVTGEYVPAPSDFPCVSIEEKENVPYLRSRTTDSVENHVSLLYEVNVYSNKQPGKKSEAKAIAAAVDEAFAKLGFERTMLNPIPNLADATIYRITGRYRAVMDNNRTVYRIGT